MKLSKPQINKFRQTLLNWYHQNKRNLPFRKTSDPYKIWLSEIMLQQTTVNVVLDYYKSFLKRFPNIKSVAKAKEQELLNQWQGLGYYSRVRNFQQACRQVIKDHKGKIPKTYDELKSLKGVGEYTAAAIGSICFNLDKAVVDGNVKRVLARLFQYKKDSDSSEAKNFFIHTAQQLLDPDDPGDFNQAVMELGATVCGTNPQCLICPVRKFCSAAGKNPHKLPIKRKTKYFPVKYESLVLHHNEKLILKKPHKNNLIANMWELPSFYDQNIKDPLKNWQKTFKTQFNIKNVKKIGTVNHSITNKRISAHFYACQLTRHQLTKFELSGFKVIEKSELESLTINTLSKKILKKYFDCNKGL